MLEFEFTKNFHVYEPNHNNYHQFGALHATNDGKWWAPNVHYTIESTSPNIIYSNNSAAFTLAAILDWRWRGPCAVRYCFSHDQSGYISFAIAVLCHSRKNGQIDINSNNDAAAPISHTNTTQTMLRWDVNCVLISETTKIYFCYFFSFLLFMLFQNRAIIYYMYTAFYWFLFIILLCIYFCCLPLCGCAVGVVVVAHTEWEREQKIAWWIESMAGRISFAVLSLMAIVDSRRWVRWPMIYLVIV